MTAMTASAATGPLHVTDTFHELDLSPYLEILEDPHHDETIETIRQPTQAQRFQSKHAESLNWGFSESAIWLRLRMVDEREDKGPLVAELNYSQIDRVEFWWCKAQYRPGQDWSCVDSQPLKYQLGGRLHPETRRAHASPTDELTIPRQSRPGKQAYVLWIRAETGGSMQLPITLRTQDLHQNYRRNYNLLQGLYFGGLTILILYNLLVGLSLWWGKYIGYVFYMLSWVVFQFFLSGYGFIYFGDWLPEFIGPKIIPIGILAFGEFALYFALMFLPVRSVAPRFFWFVFAFATSGMVCVLLSPFMSYGQFIRITMLGFTPIWVILEFACGIISLKRHRRTALLYLSSWGALVLGSVVVMLRTIGLVDINFFTVYAQQIGSWLEGLLMSLAMADVINQLRKKTDSQARDLGEANRELRRLDKLKDEFMANTSHELRTPLHGILGLADSILTDPQHHLTDDVRHKLRLITASSQRLSSLVNDILDFSKLQHDDLPLQLKAVDVRSMVQLVCDLLTTEQKMDQVALTNRVPEDLPHVIADENRLQQILLNLVGNALKFTEHGLVTIDAEVQNGRVYVHVRDQGIGIAEDKMEAIFNPFTQSDASTTRKYGGTGLGLSITKKLVELHKGTISATSKEGEGSCFTFTLPLTEGYELDEDVSQYSDTPSVSLRPRVDVELPAEPDFKSAKPVLDLEQQGRQQKILVADDDALNIEVIRSFLDSTDYQLTIAMDGEDAIHRFTDEGPFDLVLCDVMMPKKSGYEVCRHIRQKLDLTKLPIILLTAKSQVNDLVSGFDAGANDYLVKPFAKKELLSRIQTQLEISRNTEVLSRFVPIHTLKLLGRERISEIALGDTSQQNLCVMFADIRNFTQIAEGLNPSEAFQYVNQCMARMGPQIRNHRGFIDKYVGDAILALFPQGSDNALDAVVAMHREIAEVNHEAKTKLSIGFGVHVGPTIFGTIGEPERFDVTVISDTVNVASRLENLTKILGVACLLTDQARIELANAQRAMRYVGLFRLSGKSHPVRVYEFLDILTDEEKSRKLASEGELLRALESIEQCNLKMAESLLASLAAEFPEDSVIAYHHRACRELIDSDRSSRFDGSQKVEKWVG
jgi:signal transduction histidine kinase/class 3 adenylate cyclase